MITVVEKALEREVAGLLISALNIEGRDAEAVDPQAPLFGAHDVGWGLDSIDALEVALAIQQKYGVELRADEEATRRAFGSIRTLAEYVATHRAPV